MQVLLLPEEQGVLRSALPGLINMFEVKFSSKQEIEHAFANTINTAGCNMVKDGEGVEL
ncbi:hypothetical protein [Desulfofundulus thermosubterraneus]|uniref:hypothetical protein n=1 Tax=Desulfofundulus thermosubterraneus TaxID=348840 RepID=UPI0013F4D8F0|nr:hypothetical protein [Desulfofundulus thermosubterraneus]